MTHTIGLSAKLRDTIGKASHRLAGEGLIPAVVYGPKIETMSLSVDQRDFDHLMHEASVGSTLVDLAIEGREKPLDVIIKEVKRDEVKGHVQHIDFWAVDMGNVLQTTVAIDFVGSAQGEREGGVIMHSLRELKIEARPKDLPEHIEVDVSELNIGDSLTVANLTAPSGVTLLDDPETVMVSVMAPSVEEEEPVEVGEEGEVPEVGEEEEAEAGAEGEE
ncbi:MAG: 50S ribosomal protein L25 [Coriobacteriia bacterium]|nr:50S ribosomal protein L25 [Coriobacteriia bacterium]